MKNRQLYGAGRAGRWLGPVVLAGLLAFGNLPAAAGEARVEAVQWPAGRSAGRHAATIVVADNEAEALAMRETLRAEGYPVRLRPLEGERIALRVERLGSVREATALAAEAKSKPGSARP